MVILALFSVRPNIAHLEECLPTLHWKFSDTVDVEVGDSERKKLLLLKDILDKVSGEGSARFSIMCHENHLLLRFLNNHAFFVVCLCLDPYSTSTTKPLFVKSG